VKKRRILSALLLAFLAAAPVAPRAAAAPLQDLAALRVKAEQGDAKSQNDLGFRYEHGRGVPKDRAEAINWYTKSGEQGFGAGQNNLCALHSSGLKLDDDVTPPKGEALGPIKPVVGNQEDADGAAKWCRKAADQGFVQSQRLLGIYLAKGVNRPDGTEIAKPDYEEAYFWLNMRRKTDFRDAVADKLTAERRAEIEKKSKNWKPPGHPPAAPPTTPTKP
jgi:TPR repeat protein